ncbi:hypothetical protein AB6A40_002377 [Gnathostoma spinigerum]|uniref:Galectin n=1 Tax=Gnathostoma spinigerum TaxID=75299 RepID=A0ABD6E6E5_9BILA
MELFALTAIIISSLYRQSAGEQNQCGCIDRNWCDKKDPSQKFDCPLSNALCTSLPLTHGESTRIEQGIASVSTECKDGWSTASLKSTTYGSPNPLVSIIQNDVTDGNEHTLSMTAYGGKYPARILIKSKGSENIPLFMTMFLWNNYLLINEKKDGQWCANNVRVYNRVYWENWDMEFKKGDWFVFYEESSHILGLAWSRSIRHVQFKTNPTPGSRIVIHGALMNLRLFKIMFNNGTGHTKFVITGYLGYRMDDGEMVGVVDENYVEGYGQTVACSMAWYTPGMEIFIVIEVTPRGIKYYTRGWLLCTFESDEFKLSDISQIDVNGALNLKGYVANTCDPYLY